MLMPVSFAMAETMGWARNPAASTPARVTNCCCWPAESWLVDVLNTMSERMSDGSSGGVLARRSSGCRRGPKMLTRASTPEITRVTVTKISGFRSPRKLIELDSKTLKLRP